MRIAYVTNYDILDSSSWPEDKSGICGAAYQIAKALENQSIQLHYIGPLEKQKDKLVTKLKRKYYYSFFKKDLATWAEPLEVKEYASLISRKLEAFTSDIVLYVDGNFLPIAYLEGQQPIVVWIDTPLAGLIDFYSGLSNLCNETKRNIYKLEKAALEKCRLIMFSSAWAAQTAINFYEIDSEKVKVVPWGANIESDRTKKDINSIVESRELRPCKLLFIGVDWYRKGGDIAFEIAKELNKSNLDTELLVVGCPPIIKEPIPGFVKPQGFVNKNTKEGISEVNKLFSQSHFLVMPSRAESYGHVFCEANSYGVPCLATDVGGIPTIIKKNINGKTFLLDDSPSEYCNYILSLMSNYSEYKELAYSSFSEYQRRLNWAVNVQAATQLMMNIV